MKISEIADQLGCKNIKIAIVEGDDLLQVMSSQDIQNHSTVEGLEIGDNEVVAANVYLGARPIAEALSRGADLSLIHI